MAVRKSEQELYELAKELLPPVGQSMTYGDWAARVASENPKAVSMYRLLKKQGVVSASLSVQADGSIKHEIKREA